MTMFSDLCGEQRNALFSAQALGEELWLLWNPYFSSWIKILLTQQKRRKRICLM